MVKPPLAVLADDVLAILVSAGKKDDDFNDREKNVIEMLKAAEQGYLELVCIEGALERAITQGAPPEPYANRLRAAIKETAIPPDLGGTFDGNVSFGG